MLNIGFHLRICKMWYGALECAEPLFTCVSQTPSAFVYD